ncbi:LysE family transporter [Syntrophomonas zehnderi]|uniref:LysE family transporter n=1 Tax=Syntrophomonas zehnderi TaxID=404335 RepID=UPI001FA79AFA|nr:LysE family transporter [Syntrophomonas zehnderi]
MGLSGAMMPGPLLTATIVSTARYGFMAGPLIVLGHALLELALLIGLLAGFSTILLLPQVGQTVAVVGGSFLLYLGYSMLKDTVQGRLILPDGQPDQASSAPLRHPAVTGVLLSVSNPYWILWWATIGLSYLTIAWKSGKSGIISFYSGHILADLLWYSLIALIISTGSRWLNPLIYRLILIVSAVFLAVMGGYFIYSGFSSI